MTLPEVTSKLNERYRSEQKPEIQPQTTPLSHDKSFIAGQYVIPVSPKNIEKPIFDSHFEDLNKEIESALGMFLEFIIDTYWGRKKNYRASIFLHDALNKELSMRASYNMSGYKDYGLRLKDSAGNVGMAFMRKSIIMADFNIIKHEEKGVDS